MNIKDIWRRLVLEDRTIASAEEVKDLCAVAELDYDNVVDYLGRTRHIDTVMRGIFYVRSPEEVELGRISRPLNEIIAMAMEKRGITNWYFGLETALKYNHMTHQYFDITWVISDSYRTTKTVDITWVISDSYRTTKTVVMLGKRIHYLRWKEDLLTFGIIKKGIIRHSDPEKTLLDLAYRESYNGNDPTVPWTEYLEDYSTYDRLTMRGYVRHYPKRMQRSLRWTI
jgi:hypothetical protein